MLEDRHAFKNGCIVYSGRAEELRHGSCGLQRPKYLLWIFLEVLPNPDSTRQTAGPQGEREVSAAGDLFICFLLCPPASVPSVSWLLSPRVLCFVMVSASLQPVMQKVSMDGLLKLTPYHRLLVQPLPPPSSPLSSFQTLGMSRVHLFLLGHNRCLCSATGFLRSSGGSNRLIGLAWT